MNQVPCQAAAALPGVGCERLKISGDYRFEADVVCRGSVELHNDREYQIVIPAETILED